MANPTKVQTNRQPTTTAAPPVVAPHRPSKGLQTPENALTELKRPGLPLTLVRGRTG